MIDVFQLIQSVTELLCYIMRKFSPNDSHKWLLNQGNIFCYQEMWLRQPCVDNPRLACYHWNTWFRWLKLGSPSHLSMALPCFPLLLRSQGGGGACILHSVRAGIWIGLSLLEQSRAVRSRPPAPGPHLVMTIYVMSAGRIVGWMTGGALLCDISSCDDVEIPSWSSLLSLQETERRFLSLQ